MGVGGYNANPSISQHALGPMFRTGSETPNMERAYRSQKSVHFA